MRPWLELIALALSVLLWFPAEALGWKLPLLAVYVVAWGTYVVFRAKQGPERLREWGFRLDNLRPALWLQARIVVVALLAMAAFAAWQGQLRVPWSIGWLLLLYPPWALAQQFVLQNMVASNLGRLGAPAVAVIVATGLGFAFAHAPDVGLMALTGMGGLLWTYAHQRTPNLWLLALSHSLVGSLAFVWVLGRDPWQEFPALAALFG